MLRKSVKRVWAVLLAVVMMAALAGCGKEKAASGNGGELMGRYVEKEMTLPEGVSEQDIAQMDRKDGNLRIYVKKNVQGTAQIKGYVYKEADASWSESTQEWLSGIAIPMKEDKDYGKFQLLTGEGDREYLYYTCYDSGAENGSYMGHLMMSTKGAEAVDITPEEWKTPNPDYNFYESPERIVYLTGGLLAGQFYSKTVFYGGGDGKLVREVIPSKYYDSAIYGTGEQYILAACNDNGNFAGLDVYKAADDTLAAEYPYTAQAPSFSYTFVDVKTDGTLVICNADGISEMASGGGEWKMIVDGRFTSLNTPTMSSRSIVALDNGKYYINYTGDQQALMEYVFDPDMPVKADKELKVYSVFADYTLKLAAVEFQKSHPDVMVTIETGVADEDKYRENYDLADIYKNLNAKLLAGEGADILIMDKLDMDSFISKGLLMDISDVVQPLIDEGKLVSNIVNSYKTEDGKMYAVPGRFYMNLVVAKGLDASTVSDIKSLAEAAAASEESLLGSRTPADLVKELLPFFLSDIIDGKQLDKEALKEYLGYLKTIGDNCGIVDDYGEWMRGYNVWEIPAHIQVALNVDEGFAQAMLPLSVARMVNGSFDSFGDVFYPALQAGVYSKGAETELAKEFIACLLSDEVQNPDLYNGYPISVAALSYQKDMDRSSYEAYTAIDMPDGGTAEFKIGQFDEKEGARLLELCQSLNKMVMTDKKVETEIAAAIPGYLKGTQSLEDTVTMIEDSLEIYLAE